VTLFGDVVPLYFWGYRCRVPDAYPRPSPWKRRCVRRRHLRSSFLKRACLPTMDKEIQQAARRELARLRRELGDIRDRHKPPLGPPDFMRRYIGDLERRRIALEKELDDPLG